MSKNGNQSLKKALEETLNLEIANIEESEIAKRGKSVSSKLSIKTKEGDLKTCFSKCYDIERYCNQITEQNSNIPSYQHRSEIKPFHDIWRYESDILKTFDDLEKKITQIHITPKLITAIPDQKRVILEYDEAGSLGRKLVHGYKYLQKLENDEVNMSLEIDLANKILAMGIEKSKKTKNEKYLLTQKKAEIKKQQKLVRHNLRGYINRGINLNARFQGIANKYRDYFNNISIPMRDHKKVKDAYEDYLLELTKYKHSMNNLDDAKKELNRLEIDASEASEHLSRIITPNLLDQFVGIIHGDFGMHHITPNLLLDLDELRIDYMQFDLVRFLKNPLLELSDKELLTYSARYYVLRKYYEETQDRTTIQPWKILSMPLERIVGDSDSHLIKQIDFQRFMGRFLIINLAESLHMAAIDSKVDISLLRHYRESENSDYVHPTYKNKRSLVGWYIKDSLSVINLMLSDGGRQKFLDILEDRDTPKIIGHIRTFLERSGIAQIPYNQSDVVKFFEEEQ